MAVRGHALAAVDLYRFYHTDDDETLALRGVSLHVDSGEVVALLGPSGSGKTTLLACLAGLDEPDGGFVEVNGRRMSRRPEAERAALRAAHIGILLQHGNLLDHLTVEQNVQLAMRLAGRSDHLRLRAMLELVGLGARASATPSTLSGGEAARAGLAVALACDPAVLLADEPTGEVDAETESRILDLLEGRRRSGIAALIATHSVSLAKNADRVIRLRDGAIVDA